MPLGKALRKSFSVLRENKVLALLGDRIFGMENGVPVNFFGKRVVLPKGPAVLSLATGASIVPVFMIRNPDDTFTLHFEEPIEPGVTLPEKNENDLEMLRLKHVSSDRIDELTDKFKCVIERYIRKYPEQWYMFPVFWNEAK